MNINDLQLGFDPTGSTSIDGAELAQLITTASPSSDRGFCLFTIDDAFGTPTVPNPNTTPEFARYIWIRLQANINGFAVYIWNPNQINTTNPTQLLNWNPIALGIIPVGSIINAQLAGGITFDKISSVSLSSIINSASILLTTTNFTGPVITGNAGVGLTIGNNQVTNAMLVSDNTSGSANAAVKTNNIVNGAVTLTKLDQTGGIGQFLTGQGNGTPPIWSTLGTIKLLQTVMQDTLTSSFLAAGTLGTNTQCITTAAPSFKLTAASPATFTNVGSAGSYQSGVPCSNSTKAGGPAISVGITPLSLTSFFLVDIIIHICISQADLVTLTLYALGNASNAALPSATVNNGAVVLNNNGGSSSTAISPLINANDNGQAIACFSCASGVNRIQARFLVSGLPFASLSFASVLMPVIGVALQNTNIGFNSSTSNAGTAMYGGGILQSQMIVQEILL